MKEFLFKVQGFVKNVVINWILRNPLLWLVVGFVVGARVYETGFHTIKGATVKVTGKCKTSTGFDRFDLVRDEMVVSFSNEEKIKGTLLKTREWLDCEVKDVSIDRFGLISDLFKKQEFKTKELTEFVPPKNVEIKDDFKRLINKEVLVTGQCVDMENKPLSPFIDKTMSVTNVKKAENSDIFYIFGILKEERKAVACAHSDITFKEMETNVSEQVETYKEKVSYIDQSVYVTAVCEPDMRFYKKIGKKPQLSFYNLVDILVKVSEEKIVDDETRPKGYRFVELYGTIVDDKKNHTIIGPDGKEMLISYYGQRIRCTETNGLKMDIISEKEAKLSTTKER